MAKGDPDEARLPRPVAVTLTREQYEQLLANHRPVPPAAILLAASAADAEVLREWQRYPTDEDASAMHASLARASIVSAADYYAIRRTTVDALIDALRSEPGWTKTLGNELASLLLAREAGKGEKT